MVSRTRSYTVGAATAALIGTSLAMAAPAQAASYSVSVSCVSPGVAGSPGTVTPGVVAGDTLTVTYSSSGNQCNYVAIAYAAGQSGSGTLALAPTTGTRQNEFYSLDGTGTVVFNVVETPTVGGFILNFGYSNTTFPTSPSWSLGTTGYLLNQGALPEAEALVPTPTPADILQQTPVPASGSCTDVADEGFRYGTSVSGGWSKSWASWIGSEIGGEVCTRTLTYSNSRGAWVVAS